MPRMFLPAPKILSGVKTAHTFLSDCTMTDECIAPRRRRNDTFCQMQSALLGRECVFGHGQMHGALTCCGAARVCGVGAQALLLSPILRLASSGGRVTAALALSGVL